MRDSTNEQPRLSWREIDEIIADIDDVQQEPMLGSYLAHCHTYREALRAIKSLRIHHPAIFKKRRP